MHIHQGSEYSKNYLIGKNLKYIIHFLLNAKVNFGKRSVQMSFHFFMGMYFIPQKTNTITTIKRFMANLMSINL